MHVYNAIHRNLNRIVETFYERVPAECLSDTDGMDCLSMCNLKCWLDRMLLKSNL